MFSKILVPVDGSDHSLRALEHALFLAKSAGSRVTAIHVIEKPPTVYVESQKLLNDIMTKYRNESTKVLDRCKELAAGKGIKIETAIAEGDAASNIADYAKKQDFDIIVIGSRGLGRFKEMVVGSVSNKVLHQAKCSVLIVK
jgi:nucleotide-binding universal stress UspA family protein